jgi:NAD(P)-dependent dehydrogenase (short-subunit alcohol dehydrogenase family)
MSILDLFRLDGQVAVVTGGASGIGAAVADAYREVGAVVEVADLQGREPVDVTDERQVGVFFERVARRHGRLDIVVNNAGISLRKPTTDLTLDEWNRVVAINMTAVFLCSRAGARHMLQQKSGAIINTASIMSFSGGGLYPNISYQATKGAVLNMTRTLAVEWGPSGIRVNAVAPTWVRTPLIAPILERADLVERIESLMPLGRLAETQDIVGAFLYLASPAAAMVTGHTIAVDGGFLAQ